MTHHLHLHKDIYMIKKYNSVPVFCQVTVGQNHLFLLCQMLVKDIIIKHQN